MSIKKYESVDLKHFNESKAFIDYSNDVIDIFENIYEYNSKKIIKKKIAKYIFYLMIWLLIYLITKQLQPIITELFRRCKKKKKKWILLLLSLILLCKKILDWTLLYYNNFEQKKGSTNSN